MKPCPVRINCPDSTDSPFTNVSSEAPDIDLEWTFNNGISGLYPPLGSTWDWPQVPLWCSNDPLFCPGGQLPGASGGDPGEGTPGWTLGGGRVGVFYNSPQSCTVGCGDGSSFTYTVPAGKITALTQELADLIAYSYACLFADKGLVCMSALTSSGCLGVAYSSESIPTGGTPPYTYTPASGLIPPGLFPKTTPSGNFLLEGTPNLAGTYTFGVTVTDASGSASVKNFNVRILGVSTSIPSGNVGSPYSYSLVTTGAQLPATYSIISGSLPTGLTMSQYGTISGTPTTAQSNLFTVKVTDFGGATCTADITLTINGAALDWSQLLWQNAFTGAGGGGNASFTPSLITSPSFDCLSNSPAIGSSAASQNVATLSYKGPAVNCNLHIVMNRSGGGPQNGGIQVFTPVLNLFFANNTVANGPHDFPFTVPDTGGATITIQVVVNTQTVVDVGNPTSVEVSGTFSNV